MLLKSPRAIAAISVTLIQGFVASHPLIGIADPDSIRLVYSTTEPTLPLHLQEIWNLASSKVGLIYMAVVIPSLICEYLNAPLSG